MMSEALRLLLLAVVGMVTAPIAAQDPPAGDGPPPVQEGDNAGEETPAEPEWVVPDTFDPLLEGFYTLATNLSHQGQVTLADQATVRDLRAKVTRFNDEKTPTEQSVAAELQLLLWGNETGAPRDHVFERLESMEVTHPGLRVLWADALRQQFEFSRAVEVLDVTDIDLSRYPVAAVIRAEALLPDNQFDEAEATLASIPLDASRTGELLDRMHRVRERINELREEWSTESEYLAAERSADNLPRVVLETSKGEIILELFENEAPNTVANFISLVEKGFYDGIKFHRVEPNFVIQGGDPNTKAGGTGEPGTGGPGYTIADEFPDTGLRQHWGGYLSMANAGPNTGGSQFFITLRQRFDLDRRHTVFGRVVDGMRVVRAIEPDDDIIRATVLRKREHAYEPVVTPDPVPDPPADPPADAGTEAGSEDDTGDSDEEDGGGG